MTNDTPPAVPSGAPEQPLWSDARLTAFSVTISKDPTVLAAIRRALLEMRYEYEAALTDLRAQLAAAQTNERKPMRLVPQPDFAIDLEDDDAVE